MGLMDSISSMASSTLKGVMGSLTGSGKPLKATLTSYSDPTFKTKIGDILLPLISSDGISQKYSIDWGHGGDGAAAGESAPVLNFTKYNWNVNGLDLDVVVDATGVYPVTELAGSGDGKINYDKPNIEPYIKQLKKLVYCYDKEGHNAPYLTLEWGKIFTTSTTDPTSVNGIYKCVLSEMEIKYELYSREGLPVRAIISLNLKPWILPTDRPFGNSPDLSHIIEIKYGDNLPKLCQDIYDSPEYYHQIAKVNGLQSAYDLEPGMRLLFPPLDKFER